MGISHSTAALRAGSGSHGHSQAGTYRDRVYTPQKGIKISVAGRAG